MKISNKKIVFDARMINNSGIGRYIEKILINIIDNFDDIIILGDKDQICERLKRTDLSIIKFTAPYYSISEQLYFPKVIPQCDLFWSPHFNIPLLPIKAKKRLATVHDVFYLAFYDKLSIQQKLYSKYVIDAALNKSDRIITVSEFSKKEIIKYTKKEYQEKISVIYNGIEPFENDISGRFEPQYKNYFLAVGSVKPHKNFGRTLEAYKLFLIKNAKNMDVPHFVIIGKTDGLITGDHSIFEIVQNDPLLNKYVHFTGKIPDKDLKKAYNQALALIFPSIYEGFGFPPLEAMLENTPAIVSKAACMPEIYGDAVVYFDPYDINDISEKMALIFNNKSIREKLRAKGILKAKEYTWENAANLSIGIIEHLLSI